MDFLNYVANRMFEDNATPDNPRNVQIYMNFIIRELYELEEKTVESYRLRIQGHIEIANHVRLFGDLDPDIEY